MAMGAFHRTKNSGLTLRNLPVANRTARQPREEYLNFRKFLTDMSVSFDSILPELNFSVRKFDNFRIFSGNFVMICPRI